MFRSFGLILIAAIAFAEGLARVPPLTEIVVVGTVHKASTKYTEVTHMPGNSLFFHLFRKRPFKVQRSGFKVRHILSDKRFFMHHRVRHEAREGLFRKKGSRLQVSG